MISKKKIISNMVMVGIILLNIFFINTTNVWAENSNTTYISLSDSNITVNNENSTVTSMEMPNGFNEDMNINKKQTLKVYYTTLILLLIILVSLVVLVLILKRKGKFDMKGKILTLFIGIIIGAIIATSGFMI